jgi:hypothetical protein
MTLAAKTAHSTQVCPMKKEAGKSTNAKMHSCLKAVSFHPACNPAHE